MTKHLAFLLLATAAIIGITPSPARAQVDIAARQSLKGITTMSVLVEQLPVSIRALNVTEETLQTDVELKLRLAGMQVVPVEQVSSVAGEPYLYINVNYVNITNTSLGAANVRVELDQDAILMRNGATSVGVATWISEIVLLNPDAQHLRDALKEVVDRFLNDWLAVNPKK